jgi:hypothetical protein
LVETCHVQAADTVRILERQGLATEVVRSEELDATAVIAWPSGSLISPTIQ